MTRYSFDITGLRAMEKRAQHNKAATLCGGRETLRNRFRRESGAFSSSLTSFRLSDRPLSRVCYSHLRQPGLSRWKQPWERHSPASAAKEELPPARHCWLGEPSHFPVRSEERRVGKECRSRW